MHEGALRLLSGGPPVAAPWASLWLRYGSVLQAPSVASAAPGGPPWRAGSACLEIQTLAPENSSPVQLINDCNCIPGHNWGYEVGGWVGLPLITPP